MDEDAPKHRWLNGESLAAFGIYLGSSLFFFGRGLIGHFGDRYIGAGQDPSNQIFHLAWWPYAILHHLNPMIVHAVWEPNGVNQATVPSMPLAALLLAPVTLLGDPIRALNVFVLLAPPLSAWAAFLLCLEIAESYPPALVGGYLYGFSPFVLGHLLGQPQFAAAVFMPLAVLFTIRRLNDKISRSHYFIAISLILIGQLGFSLEFLATGSLMGAITLLIAWLLSSTETRCKIYDICKLLAVSYFLAALVAAGYLYYFFIAGPLELNPLINITFSADLNNLIIPTQTNVLWNIGRLNLFHPTSPIYDESSYIGIPVLLLLAFAILRKQKSILNKIVLWMLGIAIMLSFGPFLKIDGRFAAPLPGAFLFLYTPLFNAAIPDRFTVFSFLCVALIAASFLANNSIGARSRVVAAALLVVSFLPNLDASFWVTRADIPQFFVSGAYKKYLTQNENVLILPYGADGDTDLFLAEARFYFRNAGGYLAIDPTAPKDYRDWPIVQALYGLNTMPDLQQQLIAFLVNKDVSKVIIPEDGYHICVWNDNDPLERPRLRPFSESDWTVIRRFFLPLDPRPAHVGGVEIYSVRFDKVAEPMVRNPAFLEDRAAEKTAAALLIAANNFLKINTDPSQLSPISAARQGLLPRLWLNGPGASEDDVVLHLANGMLLVYSPNGTIRVGLVGARRSLLLVENELSGYYLKARIFEHLLSPNFDDWALPLLQLDFDREGLAKAAAYAKRQEASEDANLSEAPGKGAFAGVRE